MLALAALACGWPAVAVADDDTAAGDVEGEVIVIEDSAPPPRDNAAETRVDAGDAARVAGVRGDAVKAVQTLGGVARAAAGADGIIVWGASPADTRLYVDDIPVPRLFHLGGSRSIVPARAVSSLSLTPGGAGARYGRAIGGAVSVVTGAIGDDRVGAHASADPVDLAADTHYRLSPDTWVAAGARHSVLGRTFDLVAPDRAEELLPVPDYWDYQLRGRHRLSSSDELSVLSFGTGDRVSRGIPSVTPEAGFSERTRSWFHRLGLRLTRRHADGTTSVVAGWLGIDRDRTRLTYGEVGALDQRRAASAGALLSEERRVHARLLLRFGLDLELERSELERDGAISLPAREGDVGVFGQPPGDRVNRDAWMVHRASIGGYLAAAVDVGAGVTVEPGLRFEPGFIDGNRVLPVRPTEPAVGYTELDVALDPRLRATITTSPALQLYAAGGRYHQQPAPRDLSPIFGSPVLPPSQAWQLLVGAVARPAPWLTTEVVGFAVSARDLAVRSDLATPAIAGLLVSDGRGRTHGVQTSLRARRGGVTAWASYTLMRAQRRDHPGDRWRAFDGDQRHTLQATASWQHRAGLELGARVELSSGFPRTPVTGAVWSSRDQRYDPLFGAHNSARLPVFAAASARVAYAGRAGWGRYRVWLDVENLTNRANTEERFYSADYQRAEAVRGLPILPIVGAEAEL